jgi:two-component system KDP operon response regulator KdpE
VLVVDDDTPLRRMVALTLRSEGFDVLDAPNGVNGLNVLQDEPVDLVVLDLIMPEMDGKTFFKRAREEGYRGPFVILSSFGARQAQRELGANAAIDKPFEPEDFVETVKAVLHVA